MASLLERMNIDKEQSGPTRSAKSKGTRGGSSSPYTRPREDIPRGDVDGRWEHDLHGAGELAERLSGARRRERPTVAVPRALSMVLDGGSRAAPASGAGGGTGLSIKGAGATHNCVEVRGLTVGTSADDVKAAFGSDGAVITEARLLSRGGAPPVVRVTYKAPADAAAAVRKYDGMAADGGTLSVALVGAKAASLVARLGDAPVLNGSVDAVLADDAGGSKMRSDALVNEPGAVVLVAPPGQRAEEPAARSGGRGGNGRGGRRGRGRGKGRGGKSAGMDLD